MAICGWVPFPSHDSGCLHGDGHSLGAVQAVGGVVKSPAWVQAQAEAVRGPHSTMRVPPLVVGVLGGLGAALGCDGDERFGGGARRDRRRGLLVVGCVGDGWKRWKDINFKLFTFYMYLCMHSHITSPSLQLNKMYFW